ncbi:MAG TPA: hypothetical protein VMR90_07115 [Candidatus Cybelea sp.]|nr:hypothetical protein [Candidatus Cybelea sp.]
MPTMDGRKSDQRENTSTAKPPSLVPEAWSDQEFRAAFESLRIPNEMFHHREHIRMAWIYSRHLPEEQALARIVEGIRAFAKHHGAPAKYHHTVTVAWMRLVRHATRLAPQAPDFKTFAAAHVQLFHPRLLEYYYSKARLQSEAARYDWLDPDLRPLP